jgi:hypothetical protein
MTKSDEVEGYAQSWVFPFMQSLLPDYAIKPVPLNIQAQHRYGDKWLASAKHKHAIEIELKAEARHTGNLFVETWSDVRGGVAGWLYHYNDETRLAYAFNDLHKLYTCRMGDIRRWAHGNGFNSMLRIEDFEPKEQKKYQQNNVTIGRLVPVEVFLCEVAGARVFDAAEVTHGR